MSKGLKKRWTLPDHVIQHLFLGDVSGNSFAGFHSEVDKSLDNGKMMIDGQPNPVMIERRTRGKTYKLKVKIKLGGGGFCQTSKVSTFFPHPAHNSKWTKANIIRWIEQALTNPDDSVRHSRAAWETAPRGIRTTGLTGASSQVVKIRVNGIPCHVLYSDGVIASIYPSNLDDASPTA